MAGVVGVEMDTGVIRAVELSGSAASPRLVRAGQVEIDDEAVVEGAVADIGMVTAALRKLWAKSRFGSRDVVLGTFNQGVITRLISFPKMPKDKLDQAIRLQSGEYFPIPLSQLTMDFAVLGEKEGNNGPELEVLLVAARTAMLNSSVTALEACRLVPKVIDASPFAMLRVLPKEQVKEQTLAMVDVSHGVGSLVMLADGAPRFARVIPVSLEEYADEVGFSWRELLPALSSSPEKQEEPVFFDSLAALDEWGLKAVEEISSSINFFIKMDNRPGVDRVILSGAGARLPGFLDLLETQLDLPVEVVQPLSRMAGSQQSVLDQEAALPDFAVSTGLALRGLEV